tara:strand:- start:1223 stop:1564 length:342 start_codon:yes stop_codon:yes gene_type:complete
MDTDLYILNPKSNRFISRSSKLYFKLVKEGIIIEPITAKPIKPSAKKKGLKKLLKKESMEMIDENKHKLEGTQDLNDDELDQLLKRMLYEKLCCKKKKKKKKIVITSSDSESD